MSSTRVLQEYEQEFRELCERVEDDIRQLRNGGSVRRAPLIKQIENDLSEADSQLRGMEMEASGDPALLRQSGASLKECNSTLIRLRNELQRIGQAEDNSTLFSSYQNDECDPEGGQQMDRLLMASQRQERTSQTIANIQRMSAESEEIGRSVLENLHSQGDTIRSSRAKLDDSNEHLGRASKVLNSLERSMVMENVLKASASCMGFILVCFIFYYVVTRKN